MGVLSEEQVRAYERDGFVLLREALSRDLADECRSALWERLEEREDDPSTWRVPVQRLFAFDVPVCGEAATSERWQSAIIQLTGPTAAPTPWLGGTVAVRFPIETPPDDDGWHIDGSYVGPDGQYWANYRSRDRAMLMLVLLSEVGEDDAPTRIRVGSHFPMIDVLRPFGEDGLSIYGFPFPEHLQDLPLALATGEPGDVYLCHPFLLHAAQANRGHRPRFIAQPGVPWRNEGDGFPGAV